MSNLKLVLGERSTQIGNFKVGRLLPFREKRAVGPFVFIDHMGPANMGPDEIIDIGPHPHIGLSTLTYLFEGCILHRDSLGNALEIQPGEVNWMTAGKGIVHSERCPDRFRKSGQRMHGLQIWVALPLDLEDCDPSFSHIEGGDLPVWKEKELQIKLIAGEAFGRKSPVPVYSPLYFIELIAEQDTRFEPGDALYGESGVYILEGQLSTEGQEFGPKQMLIADNSRLCAFELKQGSRVYIFGGESFPEERHIYWNFVSSRRERIEQAKQMWQTQKFPSIPGESGYIPLP